VSFFVFKRKDKKKKENENENFLFDRFSDFLQYLYYSYIYLIIVTRIQAKLFFSVSIFYCRSLFIII
tara:strand:- start:996 stop:1196 length:201 start_codon:yes stop_codon:yes gene_type:complete